MGVLIAFNLACKYSIQKVVTVDTPIYYWNTRQVFNNIMSDIKTNRRSFISKYLFSKIMIPWTSLIQFLILLRRTKQKVKCIECPILIIQSENDDTVRIKSAQYIYDHVSTDSKSIKYFKKGGHVIFRSSTADKVMTSIGEFLQ
jgi:carboxylesterase